jgi:hypothetical protein
MMAPTILALAGVRVEVTGGGFDGGSAKRAANRAATSASVEREARTTASFGLPRQ